MFSGCAFTVRNQASRPALASILAPTALAYSTPLIYELNTPISPNLPTVSGTSLNYSVAPALPAGLTLNTSTGVISGTPTLATAATNYTVTATNSVGSQSAVVNLRTSVIFRVNTTADLADTDPTDDLCLTASGNCSLRAALDNDVSAVVYVPAGTYTITATPAQISADREIIGSGTSTTLIDGGSTVKIVRLMASGATVIFSDLTFQNGATAAAGGGGAIEFLFGALTLRRVTFNNNHANGGGANARGGAISAKGAGPLICDQCKFLNNGATYGGAVNIWSSFGSGGTFSFTNSTFQSNTASSDGAAIYVANGTGFNSTIDSSLFTSNVAASGGNAGAIYLLATMANTTTITNSTFTGNNGGKGGAIAVNYASSIVNLVNDTIAGNYVTNLATFAGGIVNIAGTVNLKNTILSGNTDATSAALNCSGAGTFTSLGHNLMNTAFTQCGLSGAAGDYAGSNPLLGALQDNGGPNFTMALSGGSPAIDTGTNTGCPTTDQRGLPRPVGFACDIGAYEAQ